MPPSTPDRADRHVYLAMPSYGEITAGASHGFWRSTRLPDSQVHYAYQQGSLLASNFNALWCDALNRVQDGERIDYFAMQHGDVEPQYWWLDTLIDELEKHDLDLLGSVVPIKDPRGVTSIALARDDGDNWRAHCRLTMSEVYRLPPTFTSEDVGRPLLLNTGLWVCRFDPAWTSKVFFTINDRIIRDPKTGRYHPQTEPEDWFFSRLCHEIGGIQSSTEGFRKLRIGCTRKIALEHKGPALFTSTRPWGEPFDSAYLEETSIPDDLPGFRFPFDVQGWLRPDEGRELARLARGKLVLEVGSYQGASTICLAQTAGRVISVDPHDGRGTAVPADTFPAFVANLARYGVDERVSRCKGTLAEFAPILSDLRFELIFIDGDHARESVEADIETCLPLLAPGGLLAFHDYESPFDPGVQQAVDAFIAAGAELLSVSSSLAVVRPPASVPSPMEV